MMQSASACSLALVVDDDDFVRGIIASQLRTVGAAGVISAANWPEARALLEGNPACDLVVSDLDMPGAEGSRFLEELALLRPGIALVIVSALDRLVLGAVDKQARKLALKVLGVIAKPTSVGALREMLQARDGG